MKYLNLKYWFELWLLTAPIFNNLLRTVNTKAMYINENIKDWNNKSISNLDAFTNQTNDKITTCVHEAGHTIITLNSKFRYKFKKMEFFPNNKDYYGQTTFDELLPLTPLPSITNNELITLLHIDLGGFAAESIFFNINFFQNTFNQLKLINSSDLYDYHRIYQKEFEIRNLKSRTENSLNFIKQEMNETIKIINNSKLIFEQIVKTCCLINYVNKNHTDYILKNQDLPIPLFEKEEIATLTKIQLQTLTNNQILSFTKEQVSWFTSEQISWFAKTQIKQLIEKQIPTFPKIQIATLTLPQIQWLFITSQIQSLTCNQLLALTKEQLQGFTTIQIQALTINQLQILTPTQLQALTKEQLQAFTTKQIQWFTKLQLQALTTTKLQALTKEQIQALRPTQLQVLTSRQITALKIEQIQKLNQNQIQALTTTQIQGLTISQMQALTEEQLQAITPVQIWWFTTNQIQSLTVRQIQTFTNTQIQMLIEIQLQALTKEQIQAITPSQLQALTPSQLQALTPAQIVALGTSQIQALTKEQLQVLTTIQEKNTTISLIKKEKRAINNLNPIIPTYDLINQTLNNKITQTTNNKLLTKFLTTDNIISNLISSTNSLNFSNEKPRSSFIEEKTNKTTFNIETDWKQIEQLNSIFSNNTVPIKKNNSSKLPTLL